VALTFHADPDLDQVVADPAILAIAGVYADLAVPKDLEVEFAFLSKEEMRALNRESRAIDEPTDVLSFPTYASLEEALLQPVPSILLGSVCICPEKAEAYGETIAELTQHALLHLCGFDHETDLAAWDAKEGEILALLAASGTVIRGRAEIAASST